MEKLDLRKTYKHLYHPSAREVAEVDVPPMNYLMVDGRGDPNTAPAFAEAIEALYAVSYTLKFMLKKGAKALDYAVMPLEGLWWADDMAKFASGDKADWQWTALIAQPDFITRDMVQEAVALVRKKKNPAALAKLRFETLREGRCAQIMHIGPFSEEGPDIARVHQFIAAAGHKPAGKHHEIYLSDIRRTAPGKWKTIIRQPLT